MLKTEGTAPPALTSPTTMLRAPSRPERTATMDQAELHQMRELISTVWLNGYTPSPQVKKTIAKANRAGDDFAARLAVRALRLEQALIVAHERIIRLEWQSAQRSKLATVGN